MADPTDRLREAVTGRYEIEGMLGKGGMASVYLARDVRHDRTVALKVLRPELAATLGPERFLREIRIAASLQHPHILPLHDSGEADGLLFYVMPSVEGESLRERLAREGELPVGDALRILRDVADALAAAHARGVVHRDIKPDNVLLSGRHALVTDFGVAKALSEAADPQALTTAGFAVGTPAYMAPEQAAGDPATDHRADIYAFGVLAYELLAGRTPFARGSAQAVLAAHLSETPPSLAAARPSVSGPLAELVERCLQKRPADRWQDAASLVEELERLSSGALSLSPTATQTASRNDAGRRRRMGALAGVLTLVAAAAAAVILIPDRPPPLDPHRLVVLPFQDRTADPALGGLGGLAAEWTAREIAMSEVVGVVPSQTVSEVWADPALEPAARMEALTRRTGAGTAVTGTARLVDGRVVLEAEILDVRSGRLLRALPPVNTAPDSATWLVGHLAERVVGALAVVLDLGGSTQRSGGTPAPSLEAFRELDAGRVAFSRERYPEALEHLRRAHALDSTYVAPLLWVAAIHWNRGELERAESTLAVMGPHRDRLSPLDRAIREWLLAALRGDIEAEYRHAEEIYRVNPEQTFELGFSAILTNRPERAVDVMAGRAGHLHPWLAWYNRYAVAHHMLGRPREALEVVALGRSHHADHPILLWREIMERAALGQVRRVEGLLELASAIPPDQYSYALRTAEAALEFRAHGHPDAADRTLGRALDWLLTRPPEEARTPGHRFDLARVHYWSGGWEEALPLLEALAVDDPQPSAHPAGVSPERMAARRLASLGATLARLELRDEALEVAERLRALEAPYLLGEHTLGRARIAALLGDSAEAVRLLREAIYEGYGFGEWLHREPDFEALRDYPPFVELARPRG